MNFTVYGSASEAFRPYIPAPLRFRVKKPVGMLQ